MKTSVVSGIGRPSVCPSMVSYRREGAQGHKGHEGVENKEAHARGEKGAALDKSEDCQLDQQDQLIWASRMSSGDQSAVGVHRLVVERKRCGGRWEEMRGSELTPRSRSSRCLSGPLLVHPSSLPSIGSIVRQSITQHHITKRHGSRAACFCSFIKSG